MQKVVDLSGLWFLGLAIGCSMTTFRAYSTSQQEIISTVTSLEISVFEHKPYLFGAIINMALTFINIIGLITLYPQFSTGKELYKKMQSTMFF